VPSYRHRVPAGTGLVVGPGRRRQHDHVYQVVDKAMTVSSFRSPMRC
jgi:hypothetical protein